MEFDCFDFAVYIIGSGHHALFFRFLGCGFGVTFFYIILEGEDS